MPPTTGPTGQWVASGRGHLFDVRRLREDVYAWVEVGRKTVGKPAGKTWIEERRDFFTDIATAGTERPLDGQAVK
jgi:hypothetical protein